MGQKGGKFEREFCTQLSEWWAGRDDVFWRSQTSGGRATSRRKKGKATFGQYGDVAATHPLGKSLLRLVTIELKRGYSAHSAFDLVDRLDTCRQTKIEGFIEQAVTAARASKTPYWWLIVKRDQHKTMIFMPSQLCCRLQDSGAMKRSFTPLAILRVMVRSGFANLKKFKFKCSTKRENIVIMPLDTFFSEVKPEHLRTVLREHDED